MKTNGCSGGVILHFLTSALEGSECSASSSGRFTLKERPLCPLDRRLIEPQSDRLKFFFSAREYYVGFEAFIAVTLKNSIFWVISYVLKAAIENSSSRKSAITLDTKKLYSVFYGDGDAS
jgi:hypothetical protein